MSDIIRMVVVLSLIAGVCSAALTAANIKLAPQIEKQTDLFVRGPALERLFEQPAEEVLGNKVIVKAAEQNIPVFFTTQDDQVATLAVEAIGKGGYGGDIKIMVGVDLEKNLMTGMEVVSHSETPGLGARIMETGFRKQWKGLPAEGTIALTKDGGKIDSISGASFTSGAAVRGTNEVLAFVQDYKDEIMKSISAL